MKSRCLAIIVVLVMILGIRPVLAGIVVDTSQDDGFFTANPAALASLNAAVADLNAVIDFSNIGAITNDIATGTAGTTFLNFDFSYQYTHPSNGTPVPVRTQSYPPTKSQSLQGLVT